MRKRTKVTAALLPVALGVLLCMPMNKVQATEATEAPATTEQTAKKTKPYMKKLKKVKFDLKENKSVSFPMYWRGVGLKKGPSAKITNLKYADAEKEGYKQVSFTLTFKDSYRPSKAEVDKIACAKGDINGHYWYTIVDYNTGLCLQEDVTVKGGNWKSSGYWRKYGNGYYVYGYKQTKVKVTITYPEDYKGLCLGVGGGLNNKQTKADKNYEKGKTPFGKAPKIYSEKTSNFHFMRLTK